MLKQIKSWEELVGLESEDYKLEIDLRHGCGNIIPKDETEETQKDYFQHHVYLSTHTFYPSHYRWATEMLQKFGFDVELVEDK